MSKYFGVDVSAVALEDSRNNIRGVAADFELVKMDFVKHLQSSTEYFNVISIGLGSSFENREPAETS